MAQDSKIIFYVSKDLSLSHNTLRAMNQNTERSAGFEIAPLSRLKKHGFILYHIY